VVGGRLHKQLLARLQRHFARQGILDVVESAQPGTRILGKCLLLLGTADFDLRCNAPPR